MDPVETWAKMWNFVKEIPFDQLSERFVLYTKRFETWQ